MKKTNKRPVISDYLNAERFLIDMLVHLKSSQRYFSVVQATQKLRRVSPTLISHIRKGVRRITIDRVDELSKLLKLTVGEKRIFKMLVSGEEVSQVSASANMSRAERISTHILRDWINVYVKDCFHIARVQKDETLVYKLLAHIGSQQRIEKSIHFLLREGHLRRTTDGRIVINSQVSVADDGLVDEKVQNFHRNALGIAKDGIRQFSSDERYANALTIGLDDQGFEELLEIIQQFSEKLIEFAGKKRNANRLYQFVLNLSPTGGAA